MKDTVSIQDLGKYSDSIYEAIVVISKRARQINEEQKRKIEMETGINDSISDSDEDDDDFLLNKEEQRDLRLPKPTQLAMQEFIEGKIKFDYGVEKNDEK
ncbi:hypothetical protein B6I21_01825 [candidate division KSB1 bacterium 4572_119]|nr:MAG: hypothetical protein B6I21_01825 [candidate division KSB1 bacterium 4572_119]